MMTTHINPELIYHEKDITGYTMKKRFFIGLSSRKVKTFVGRLEGNLYRFLQKFPEEDEFILLSQNAEDKESALSEADNVVVNFILSNGEKYPTWLFLRNFGKPFSNKDKYLQKELFQRIKKVPEKRREFFQRLFS